MFFEKLYILFKKMEYKLFGTKVGGFLVMLSMTTIYSFFVWVILDQFLLIFTISVIGSIIFALSGNEKLF